MPRFMFWNVNHRPIDALLAELANAHKPELICLAECSLDVSNLLGLLNAGSSMAPYNYLPTNSRLFRFFATFSPAFLTDLFDGPRIAIKRLTLPMRDRITICAAHLPSKLRWSNEDQAFECTTLSRRIREVEASEQHERTVVFGDFNMSPYEAGMVSANGFNATMSKSVASRGQRVVQDESYPFFYNPMWSKFGDAGGRSSGSYYHDSGGHVNYYWHLFDQVMVRPSLLDHFSTEDVLIASSTASVSLVSKDGRPDRSVGSDHLPLFFKLNW